MTISALKRAVFDNERAADCYLTLRARYADGAAPGDLADQYFDSVQARDAAGKLALECFIREKTARYCHVDAWRDCLAAMEKHKARGVMGTGGARMLQDIAAAIESLYAEGLYDRLPDGRIQFRVFTGGTPGQSTGRPHIKLTCENRAGAVRILAAKYRRGLGKSRSARYGYANA